MYASEHHFLKIEHRKMNMYQKLNLSIYFSATYIFRHSFREDGKHKIIKMFSRNLSISTFILFGFLQAISPAHASDNTCPKRTDCCKEVSIDKGMSTCETSDIIDNTTIKYKAACEESYIDDIPFDTEKVVSKNLTNKSAKKGELVKESDHMISSMFDVLVNWIRLFFKIH